MGLGRRIVKAEDGILIVDLNDPGRIATANRNLSKKKNAESNGSGTAALAQSGPGDGLGQSQ